MDWQSVDLHRALIQITAPHFCAGVIPGSRAAPIIHYMRNWTEERIAAYCARKKWKMEVVRHGI